MVETGGRRACIRVKLSTADLKRTATFCHNSVGMRPSRADTSKTLENLSMQQRLTRRAFTAGLCAPLLPLRPGFAQSCAPPAGGTPAPFGVPAGQTNVQRKA